MRICIPSEYWVMLVTNSSIFGCKSHERLRMQSRHFSFCREYPSHKSVDKRSPEQYFNIEILDNPEPEVYAKVTNAHGKSVRLSLFRSSQLSTHFRCILIYFTYYFQPCDGKSLLIDWKTSHCVRRCRFSHSNLRGSGRPKSTICFCNLFCFILQISVRLNNCDATPLRTGYDRGVNFVSR